MAARGKILVIRGGAIGDFILTLPAIAALRQYFPDAHLEVLGYPHIVQLAVAGGLVDKAERIEAPALAGFFARGGTLSPDMSDYFSEFDIIVSYLYDPDAIFRTNVGRCSPAQFIQGPHRPDERQALHASAVFLKPLERLAIFGADPVPHLVVKNTSSVINQVALHPGSGSEKKNWPEEKWAAFLEHLLQTTNHTLLLVGGLAETERLQRLAAALPPTRLRLALNRRLSELAGLLQSCTCFVGHDSGISHLAAALDLPGLLLWGPSQERIWRPPSEKMRLLSAPGGLKMVATDAVIMAFQELTPALRVRS